LDDITPRNRPEKEKHIGRQGYSITNIFYFWFYFFTISVCRKNEMTVTPLVERYLW
jgi:hypothetical protein